MTDTLQAKIERMQSGRAVIMSDDDLDRAGDIEIRSIFNPQRVGIKDKYVCWIGSEHCPDDCGSRYRVDFDHGPGHGRSSMYVWAQSAEDAEHIGTQRFTRIYSKAPIGTCTTTKFQHPNDTDIALTFSQTPYNRF